MARTNKKLIQRQRARVVKVAIRERSVDSDGLQYTADPRICRTPGDRII